MVEKKVCGIIFIKSIDTKFLSLSYGTNKNKKNRKSILLEESFLFFYFYNNDFTILYLVSHF